MTASIMMVTYNRLDLTKETLRNLFLNTKYPYNLIIVDNGSSDETISYLDKTLYSEMENHESFKDYRVISNRKNLGVAIGRNLALYEAVNHYKSEWLATVDNDVILPSGWLTEAIEIIDANPRFASIGVNVENLPTKMVTFNGKTFQEKQKGNLGTAAMVFNKKLHKMLGYFNHKDFGLYGEEDSDWGMRTRVLGFRLGYIEKMGSHLGVDEKDQGEYREFKTRSHRNNLKKFNNNVREYMSRKRDLYIDFNPDELYQKE